MKTVIFKGWKCRVEMGHYENGATSLRLIDVEDGSPVATCSTDLTEEAIDARVYRTSDKLPKDRCYIKMWGENEEILKALEEAEIVISFFQVIPVGPYGSYAEEVQIL